jgi:hypothetical protein
VGNQRIPSPSGRFELCFLFRLFAGAEAAVLCSLILAALFSPRAYADPTGASYFFATPQACAASGPFGARECANAFANAKAEFEEKAPRFRTIIECVIRFQQCERATSPAPVDAESFAPALLGVEISESGQAAPVLAVVNPRGLFRPRGIARLESGPGAGWGSPILRADRFEPLALPFASPDETAFGEEAPEMRADALDLDGETRKAKADPLAQARRQQRLKHAPFVE